MQYISVVKGDKNYKLRFHITDQDDKPIDLIDTIIKFRVKDETNGIIVDGKCEEISDEYPLNQGYCCYTVKENDFNEVGLYDAEIEITWTLNDQVLTIPDIRLLVQEELS